MTKAEIIAKIKAAPKGFVSAIFCKDRYNGKTLYFVSSTEGNEITCVSSYREKFIFNSFDTAIEVKYYKRGIRTKMATIQKDKKPRNRARHVGVEIEFISSLTHHEIRALLADLDLQRDITVKDDGSIDTDDDHPYSHEICLIASEAKIADLITKVCKVLNPYSDVNDTCGLHVHLDMRKRDPKQAYANLFAAQPLLYAMCPAKRATGSYSQAVEFYDPFDEDSAAETERYVGINKTSYEKHKTLEIRIHSGSLNASKINNWVELLIEICDKNKQDTRKVELIRDYSQIKETLKLTTKLDRYVKERISKFKPLHDKKQIKITKIAA